MWNSELIEFPLFIFTKLKNCKSFFPGIESLFWIHLLLSFFLLIYQVRWDVQCSWFHFLLAYDIISLNIRMFGIRIISSHIFIICLRELPYAKSLLGHSQWPVLARLKLKRRSIKPCCPHRWQRTNYLILPYVSSASHWQEAGVKSWNWILNPYTPTWSMDGLFS